MIFDVQIVPLVWGFEGFRMDLKHMQEAVKMG
jgi:hypothetical protein